MKWLVCRWNQISENLADRLDIYIEMHNHEENVHLGLPEIVSKSPL